MINTPILIMMTNWNVGFGGSISGGYSIGDFVAHPRVWTLVMTADYLAQRNRWNMKLGYVKYNTNPIGWWENPLCPYGQGLILEALWGRDLFYAIRPEAGVVFYALRNYAAGGDFQFPAGFTLGLSVGNSDYGFEGFLGYRWEIWRLKGYWGHYGVSQPLFDTDEDAPAFFRLYSLTLHINLYLYQNQESP